MKPTNTLKADELLYTDNYSSWRRMLRLARFYWPLLKPCIIGYPLVILALCIISGLGARYIGAELWPASLFVVPIDIMWVFAPVTLTRRDYRFVSQQLPVTAAEKLSFLLITFLIVFPAIISVALSAGELIVEWCVGVSLENILPTVTTRLMIIGLLQVLVLTVISLYYTVTSSNRAFAGMISSVVAYILLLVASGIVMFGIGFYEGYMGVCKEVALSSPQGQQMIERATDLSQYIVLGLFVLIGIRYISKLYKFLRNSGF